MLFETQAKNQNDSCMKVSILDGIVMGGGAGISIHGRF